MAGRAGLVVCSLATLAGAFGGVVYAAGGRPATAWFVGALLLAGSLLAALLVRERPPIGQAPNNWVIFERSCQTP